MKIAGTIPKMILLVIAIVMSGTIFSQESFYVYFMQNGKRINIKKSKIELKKEPFEIFIEYTAPVDLWVSSTFDDKIWHKAVKGKLLNELYVFKNIKNTFFDSEKTLILSRDNAFLWKKNHSDTISCLKTAKGRFYNLKKADYLYSLADSNKIQPKKIDKNVYLVFIYPEKDNNGEYIEIQRETVKINWVKKYKEETKAYERKKKALAKEKIKTAKYELKKKQKLVRKEKKRLDKLEKEKQKRLEKQKKKTEKENKKKK